MRGKKRPLPMERPTVNQLEAELAREKYRRRYGWVLRSTIYTLITVAAVAVLVAITVSFYIIGNAFADAADPKNHVN